MLRDDQSACSFTSSSIYDLSNVEGTGTPAGKDINQVVNVATIWATSDALAAIEDIQTLSTDPGNAQAPATCPSARPPWPRTGPRPSAYVRAAEHILHASSLPTCPTFPPCRPPPAS